MKEMPPRPSRRRVLRAASVGLGGVTAGCVSSLASEDPEKPERSADAPPLKWISNANRYPWQTPTHYDRTIYAGSSFHVSAVDVANGSERWSYEIDAPSDSTCYRGKLDVADGTVYTAGCEEVYAINDAGEVEWAVENGRKDDGSATAPAISETALFIGGKSLVRRDRSTGDQQWKTEISGLTLATPALGEESVFVGTSSGRLEALDQSSGESRFMLDTETDHASAPVFGDGVVFVGTAVFPDDREGTGYLYAADVEEERWLWRVETGHLLNELPPTVHEGTVFVANDAGTLYAVSATDGSVQWTYETGAENPAAPRVGDDNVYVASGERVHAVNIDTGEQRWYIEWNETTVSGAGSPPLVTSDSLFVGTSDRLYAFDLS